MDESTNTLLYTATYVMIFIIALSLSIVLFLGVNKYADSAFEYSSGINASVINTPTTGIEETQKGQIHLTSSDVFSYFVNYVKKDLYGTDNSSSTDYTVIITTKAGELTKDVTYSKAMEMIGNDKYILRYVEGKKVTITKE